MGKRLFSYWGLGWGLRDVLQNYWLSYDFMVLDGAASVFITLTWAPGG